MTLISALEILSIVAPLALKEVEEIERRGEGIMAIFHETSKSCDLYAAMVFAFVNETAEKDEPLARLG